MVLSDIHRSMQNYVLTGTGIETGPFKALYCSATWAVAEIL